jgi:hypothetical protein
MEIHSTISERHTRHTDMTTSIDHRKAAEDSLQALVTSVEAAPRSDAVDAFLAECASLKIAIRAFHMEAIRFRMFNVDRMIGKGSVTLTDDARAAFADVRRHLEAAGFHTRSHQAPT